MTWNTSNRKERLPSNWNLLRRQVLRRDEWICQLGYPNCQTEATDVDHIVAGDNHDLGNLQAACPRCHQKKSSREGGQAAAAAIARRKELRRRPVERHPGRRT